jgi:riboflavin kinase / FMN adenylyltransferase
VTEVHLGLDGLDAHPSTVTIGNFDGVHRGHRVLLRRAVDGAREHEVRSAAITFDPHPAAVLRPGSEPAALQTLEQRVEALTDVGIDVVVVLPFTRELAALAPDRFVEQVLVERLRAVRVTVGTNFRFGHRAAGDVVTLVEEGDRLGFAVEAVTLLDLDGRPISSSAIREHLADGDVDWARRALGRPHAVEGEVVAGDGRGRTIGVPTANLAVPEGLVLPGDGVYAGHARTADGSYACVTNVGVRPTFDGTRRTVEAHLLDVDLDLYGQRVTVSFEHRIRGERRFAGVDELLARIRRDIAEARDHLDGGSVPG